MSLKLDYQRYQFPMAKTLKTQVFELNMREGFIVWLDDDQEKGFGDVAPLPPFSKESLNDVEKELKKLRGTFDPAKAIDYLPPTLQHGIEQARLNLFCKTRKLSLTSLLGVKQVKETIKLSALVSDLESAEKAFDDGIGTIKLKVGHPDIDHDLKTIKSIRQRLDPTLKIRLDANASYDRKQALAACRAFEPFNIECIEQPLAADDIGGMRALCADRLIPIAADESLRSIEEAKELINEEAADVFVIKPMLCGGLSKAIAIADIAARAKIPVFFTSTLESALGTSFSALAASWTSAELWPCGFIPSFLPRSEIDSLGKIVDGALITSSLATDTEIAERLLQSGSL